MLRLALMVARMESGAVGRGAGGLSGSLARGGGERSEVLETSEGDSGVGRALRVFTAGPEGAPRSCVASLRPFGMAAWRNGGRSEVESDSRGGGCAADADAAGVASVASMKQLFLCAPPHALLRLAGKIP